MRLKFSLRQIADIAERDEGALDLLKKRLLAVFAVVVFFLFIIVLRLWILQINDGDEYEKRAYGNRVRIRQLVPPRGHILDRNGKEIVTNRPSFNVVLTQEDSHDLGNVLKRLAPILDMDVSELWEKIRDASDIPKYVPVLLKEDIDWQTLAYLENHNHDFSGVRTEVQPVRVYQYEDLAANIIGYLGSISKKELETADREIYTGGDIVGKKGWKKNVRKIFAVKKGSVTRKLMQGVLNNSC